MYNSLSFWSNFSLAFFTFLLVLSCNNRATLQTEDMTMFKQDLNQLKAYFDIPGIAAIVKKDSQIVFESYMGVANTTSKTKINRSTLFPIASITKVFSTVLALKMVEEKKIALDDPITKYLPNLPIGDSVLIKHILSHTSQGIPGQHFLYSSRFGLIAKVLEIASNQDFQYLMKTKIFEPLKLTSTFLLIDSAQIASNNFASPYIKEDNGTKEGFIEYGFSGSAGIVSNLKDLLLFDRALNTDIIMDETSRSTMKIPFNGNPYGMGIFVQDYMGEKLIWSYGQYDCYSSLLLKVPSKNMTLILLANNNLLSDPPRLIYGNIKYSLFAQSFLKNFVFKSDNQPLMTPIDSFDQKEISDSTSFRDILLARALSASFMARFEPSEFENSKKLLTKVFYTWPNYLAYSDLNLMHNLAFLKDIAFYRDLGEFELFDNQIEQIGSYLLEDFSNDPYAHIYLGTYFFRKEQLDKAKFHFNSIINANNFSDNWYTREAKDYLNRIQN